MAFTEFRTSPDLAPFVEAIWVSATDGEGESVVLPDACVEIVVAPEGAFALDTPVAGDSDGSPVQVLGLAAGPLVSRFRRCPRLAGIRLTATGALRLFSDDLALLSNRSTSLERLLPRLAQEVAGGIEVLMSRGRLEGVEAVLREALTRSPQAAPKLEQATALIHSSGGRVSVHSLAAHAGLSVRQMDRSFARLLGISPKLLSRVARFRTACALGLTGRRGGWASVAAQAGYADQAHLARDFAEFSGGTPGEFIQPAAEDVRFLQDGSPPAP
jgi:AraC-like DNA-binding protein